ncbi:hypothetical protein G6F56_010902 [Rhizopus delemar]|nr:hypothetical protein G6F56_010902 [Rhizopus delemar]
MLPSTLVDTTQMHGLFSFSTTSPPPPTQAHIDIMRYTWEYLCSIRLPEDDVSMSPSYAFGSAFFNALFETEPALEFVFTNIVHQARAFAGMMSCLLRIPASSTIREINANKRRGRSLSFSELVTATSAFTEEHVAEDRAHQLRELGARHYLYNLSTCHLDLVGPALIKALEVRLGNEFLPEVQEAWEKTQTYVIYHMKTGLEMAQNKHKENQGELAQERQGCHIQ